MSTDNQILLAANALIHQYGECAEEFVTTSLWKARHAKDEAQAAEWQALIEALKEVRDLRKTIT